MKPKSGKADVSTVLKGIHIIPSQQELTDYVVGEEHGDLGVTHLR
jgi:hypothetical protein